LNSDTNGCDSWNQDHVCTHWHVHIFHSRPQDCDAWDEQNQVCTHWKVHIFHSHSSNNN
jgi:hypothetical protein